MSPRIELVYDAGCPNLAATREVLLRALAEEGVPPSWTEWERGVAESPPYARSYGSPTILVNGKDIAGATSGEGAESCRLYDHGCGVVRGVPPIALVRSALKRGDVAMTDGPPTHRRSLWRVAATAPGVIAALLPIGKCPACWPAYAGVLSSLGLGFLFESGTLLPVIIVLFILALLALGYRARSRRGYGPLGLGTGAAGVVLAGKFVLEVDLVVYAGLALFLAASVWNAWLRRERAVGSCPKCVEQ